MRTFIIIHRYSVLFFKNNSINNLDKNLGENDFDHVIQEFKANALNLLKKKGSYD